MKRILIIGSIAALVIIIIVVIFYLRGEKDRDEIVLFGNVDVRLVDIGFRVAGQVEQVLVDEGDLVPKGTLVATLKKNPYDSEVEIEKANLEGLLVNLANAEALFRRREALIGVGGVSREDYETSFTSYQNLIENIARAEGSLKVAMDQLSYTEAYAPEDGIVLTRIREPGTVVAASNPVLTLSVLSPVWVRAFISEPDLGVVYYGMPAKVYTDTGKVYEGKVGFISPMAEFTPKTVETTELRTDLVYRLRIYVDNPDRTLLQGMPVTVKLSRHDRNTSKN